VIGLTYPISAIRISARLMLLEYVDGDNEPVIASPPPAAP
jgi:hypothetical protein